MWHSTSKYRRTVWQCNGKFKGDEKCHTPHLYEEDLKTHFLSALSELLSDRTALLEDGRLILQELLDFEKLDAECDGILQAQEGLSGLVKKLVDENAAQAISQEAYIDRYNSLVDRYESLQARYDTLQKRKEQQQIQAAAISTCLDALAETDLLRISFSETLWNTVVDHVVVYADDRLVFHFKNGARVM